MAKFLGTEVKKVNVKLYKPHELNLTLFRSVSLIAFWIFTTMQ